MATGVNVKMGVSGVQQFKNGIKTAQDSVKTLDQALALNEKQFKATGDAEEYMKTKSELLQVKLKEQEAIVQQAEAALEHMNKNGVDKASTAYQKMQQELLRAKGTLIDTQTEIEGVGEAGIEAENGVSAMNDELDRIGKNVSLETVKSGIDSITSGLENAAKKAIQFGQKIVQNVFGAANWADNLLTRATFYEITPEQLQRMEKTADLIDTDVETIISAQQKLRKAMGKESSKETLSAFEALGIDPSNHDWETTFWKAGEALTQMTDKVERDKIALQLFGKNFNELLPLFNTGREKYEETMEGWNVVSDENVQKLGELDDSYQKLQNELETLKNTFWAELAPAVQVATDALTELMKQFNEYLDTDEGKEAMKSLSESIESLFRNLTNIEFSDVMNVVKGAIDGIVEGLKWLSNNWTLVRDALIGIAIGFGALKLASFGISVGQLISGFKGLAGGGAAAGAGAGAGAGAAGGGAASGFGSGAVGTASTLPMTISAIGQKVIPAAGVGILGFEWWKDNTKAGNILRDGGTAEQIFEAAKEEVSDKVEEIKENASTFFDDWSQTLTTLLTGSEYGVQTGGGNHVGTAGAGFARHFGDDDDGVAYVDVVGDPIFKDRRPNGTANKLQAAIEKMNEAADDSTKASETLAQGSLKPADIAKFDGLPDAILSAVKAGVANITVVVSAEQLGAAVAPAVNSGIGSMLALFRE